LTQKQWYAAEVKTTARNREAIEYGLMEAGALGTETAESQSETGVTGYFAAPVDEPRLRNALHDALRIYSCQTNEALHLKVTEFADHDWLAEWKANWQPVAVGRFIVAPPWLSEPGADRGPRAGSPRGVADATGPFTGHVLGGDRSSDPILIRINPGMAFGTGTHETTRLCLKAIERHFRGGSFLDVGTGTGILAIAAVKMYQQFTTQADRIVACDTDAEAIDIAKQNAALNGLVDQIDFRVGSIDEGTESADLVCANLTAPVILDLLPALLGVTCGRLVLSGILDEQAETIKARLLELAVVDFEIDQDGEWITLVI
jgi:ribosomal protein L11 methyltransferase